MSTSIQIQFARFLVVGLVNTTATYALFVVLGLVMPPELGYTIAFSAGLLWVAFGTSRYVFRTSLSWRVGAFVAWYLCLFGLGQLVLAWLGPTTLVDLLVASGVLMVVTVPLSFLGGRLLLAQPSDSAVPERGPESS